MEDKSILAFQMDIPNPYTNLLKGVVTPLFRGHNYTF